MVAVHGGSHGGVAGGLAVAVVMGVLAVEGPVKSWTWLTVIFTRKKVQAKQWCIQMIE